MEATVRSMKHPFPAGQLPVRGQFRVACLMIASAATANVRRIQRYLVAKTKTQRAEKSTPGEPKRLSETAGVSFFVSAWACLARWLRFELVLSPKLGC